MRRFLSSMLQRARQATAGARLEGALRRLGLGQVLLGAYEGLVRSAGVHAVVVQRQRLAFVVSTREEITRVDMFPSLEGEFLDQLVRCLEDGDVVFDVGANVGMISAAVSVLAPVADVTVHAFEPSPNVASRARENLRLNGCANVVVHAVALGDTSGEALLHGTEALDSSGRASLVEPLESDQVNGIMVPIATGDAFSVRHGLRPTVLKIDVEGAEMDVLLGLEHSIVDGLVRDILIEIHPGILARQGLPASGPTDWLLERGFREMWRHERGGEVQCHLVRARGRQAS